MTQWICNKFLELINTKWNDNRRNLECILRKTRRNTKILKNKKQRISTRFYRNRKKNKKRR